ncbi:BMC domain-containing protein [Proteus mirabilis]|uniref:BMC domain-containing protein n=1 Tax=Proteus mirabilis TaxID=584 RepID=UPI0018C5D150|nr:BMC domain-containing protein [Proteus mirabilis]EKV6229638.1 BMC domain-containing protein [Proteus mirabilis]MBG3004342.1 BMC domain-containing protein [Proteus mirabilis]MBG3083104.1 BMC domain-containing protein [Proteus mirabilis]MBG3087142.1 BMC domain-containing protein [Proteus mirabilis]MBG5945160.1 BMC domain-containing protein [Proteus mirabilis]
MNSLGVIETRGLTAAIQAADAACKAASVEIIGYRKIGSGLVSVCFQGEISAVKTAVEHGVDVVSQKELVIGSLVIARPEPSVITKLLTIKGKKKSAVISEETQQNAFKTLAENRVETVMKHESGDSDATKEAADRLAQNSAPETKAITTDKAPNSKKESKPESRKGKK